uniref:Secreted protein n=1 Tax=Ascaris lumbricoides TaxID=6252 RepID=A0A0M3I1V3_ASCLU
MLVTMLLLVLLLAASCVAAPRHANSILDCVMNNNPSADCYGARFVPTDGIRQQCMEHVDCYDYREPMAWCRPGPLQRWTNEGCHCDFKQQVCVMNRENEYELEYAYCRPAINWSCQ